MTNKRDDDDVDGFLNHGGSTNFGGLFLQSGGEKGWRKQGKIDVWFYMHTAPKALWSHQFHEIRAVQEKKTRAIEKQVWGSTFNCLEEENVLRDRRRDDDGNRLAPFTRCPFCKLVEATRALVRDGKLDWVEPIFTFVGDDKRKVVTVHAAGIYNGYRDVEKGSPEAKALNDAGIYVKDAWKENSNAGLKYLFLVVPDANPKGVMIATEAESLGKAVQKMVRKERMRDDVKGNPWVNPYCIRWIYDDAALKWDDKYDAAPLGDSKPLTDGIRKLIDGPRPDIANLLAPGSPATLRARMEAHATKAFRKLIDWDAIFDVPEPEKPAAKPAPAAEKKKTIPCDDCGAAMDPKATKCPKCGVEYEPDEDDEDGDPPESEKPVESKSAAKRVAEMKRPPPPKVEEADDEEDEDDDLPFDRAQSVR